MNIKRFFQQYPAEIFLFLSAFFIRFPFFFRDYIDQDESTFILMGKSITDGFLPYDRLWDLKPPLLFYLFAFIEEIFPHSFVAIRFFGVIIIFLSALLLMKIARQANLKNGFLIALAYVILSSEFGSLQGVMSEHFAVFFLLLGLVFYFRKKKSYDLLIAGVAFGCAVLCKLNYAYAILALIILNFILEWRKENLQQEIKSVFLLAIGTVIPLVLISIPFIYAGKLQLFINSVFLAPLEYSKAPHVQWIDKLKISWCIIVLTGMVCYLSVKFSTEENKKTIYTCVAILIGTVYTFYSSGIVNGHYLVQVYPFLLLLLFALLNQKTIRVKWGIAAAAVVVLSFESISEYYRLIASIKNPPEYRPTFEVVSELKKRKLDTDKIFFADYHIAYWLLNQYPLTKSTTHPSNLSRPYLFKYYNDSNRTSLHELKYIMEKLKPEVVVSKSTGLDFFADSSAENLYFKKNLSQNFEEIYQDSVDKIFIWKRR